ncbi:MAG: hypothetical protein KBC38_00740 [Candidatus Pacebacteria bacterium]|nr:hypothetical protein [Candidatus Paceibacterota bacterium]MBP9840523.1 hypothetical protein [Candidatus Paceibacterota bacterium]
MDSILTTINSSAVDAWTLLSSVLALVVLTAVLLVFGLRGGRSALVSLILAMYAGYAIYAVFPFTSTILAFGSDAMVRTILSVAIFVVATILPYLIIKRLTSAGFGSLSFVPNLILSFLAAAFLLALGYQLFAISSVYPLTDTLHAAFAPTKYFFYWFIAPLLGLFLFAR